MRSLVVAIALVMAGAAVSYAEAPLTVADTARKDRAVSVGLWSVQGLAGIQAQYETLLDNRRWSWIAGGGFRFNAGGDYSSSTLAAGGELRWWILGRAVWAKAPPRSMLGWYLGARVDAAWTRTHDDTVARTIGQNLAIAITGTAGYRFLIKGKVELTPMVGLGATREIDLRGRLPAWRRATGRIGMTVGWMW